MRYRLEVAPGMGAPVESPELGRIIVADMFGSDLVVRRHTPLTDDDPHGTYFGDRFEWLEQFLTPDLTAVVAILVAYASDEN